MTGPRDATGWCPRHAEHAEVVPLHPANGRPVGRFARFQRLGAFVVYVLRDHSGRVLYVGVTADLMRRMAGRAAQDPWFVDVCHWQTTAEGFSTRQAASERERELIGTLLPVHNSAGLRTAYIPHGGVGGEGRTRAGNVTQARMTAWWQARRERPT